MTTPKDAQPTPAELKHWIGIALTGIKGQARPRVTFAALAAAAGVSERTAKRQFEGERDIRVGELYGFATALRTTPDAIYAEAIRLWREGGSDTAGQEAEARRIMGEAAWTELQTARETHKPQGSQKRRKA